MTRYKPKRKPTRRPRKFRKNFVFKSRFFLDFILVLILAGAFAELVFLSPLFEIKKINVSTGDVFLKKEAGNFLFQQLGKNLLLADLKEAEKKLLSLYPQIKSAQVSRRLPDGLFLVMEKREPVGLWCDQAGENCVFIDKDAAFFQDKEFKNPDSLARINFGGLDLKIYPQEKAKEILGKILEIERILRKNLEIAPAFFILKDETRVDAKTNEGWDIYFDLNSDIDLVLTKLKLLLEKELLLGKRKGLEYIDLRFSKVYYK